MPAVDSEEMDEVVLLTGRLGTSELPRGNRLLAVHTDLEDGHMSIVWHPSNPLENILFIAAPMDEFS